MPQEELFSWIEGQGPVMTALLRELVAINTQTRNVSGISQALRRVDEFARSAGLTTETVPLPDWEVVDARGGISAHPLAPSLKISSPAGVPARRRAFFMIHIDTILPDPSEAPVLREEDGRLFAPGAADAKGGIVVLLTVLAALQRATWGEELAWTALINTDEEVGSPGSREILSDLARGHDFGLIFEPALPDGALAGERKGSGNFTLVVRGRAAHAGRAPDEGRNAVNALADAIRSIRQLHGARPDLTANVGLIQGGQAVNMVPDLAIARFNIRIARQDDEAFVWVELKRIIEEMEKTEGITAQLHGAFFAPPKPFDAATRSLFERLQSVGRAMGHDILWRPTGGVCDGNRLAACGVPNIDTLGVRGDRLHSPEEWMDLASLTEKAKLVTAFLYDIVRLAREEGA